MAPKASARAKKTAPKKNRPKKKPAYRPSTKKRVKRAVLQAKEPLTLLQALRDEGLANAQMLFTLASAVASGAAKNLRPDGVILKEIVTGLGFALRTDVERLEERLAVLEQKLSEREYEKLRAREEE